MWNGVGCRHATRACEARVCDYHEPDVVPVYLELLDSPWVYDIVVGSVFPVSTRHACVCGMGLIQREATTPDELLRWDL